MVSVKKILNSITQALKASKPVSVVEHDNPNQALLALCRKLEYREPNIRKALVVVNEVDMQKLANGVAASTLYRALKGENAHQGARVILAEALGLRVEELFQ
jgi:hypothetical protein